MSKCCAEELACCCCKCALSLLFSVISGLLVLIVIVGVIVYFTAYHDKDKTELERAFEKVQDDVNYNLKKSAEDVKDFFQG